MQKADQSSRIVKKLEDRLQLLKDSRDKTNPLMRSVIDLEIKDYENILES